MIRPEEPIPFIANFMLTNKHTMKKLESLVKELPKTISERDTNDDQEIEIGAEDPNMGNGENEQMNTEMINENA
jgi:hypothetical protein